MALSEKTQTLNMPEMHQSHQFAAGTGEGQMNHLQFSNQLPHLYYNRGLLTKQTFSCNSRMVEDVFAVMKMMHTLHVTL